MEKRVRGFSIIWMTTMADMKLRSTILQEAAPRGRGQIDFEKIVQTESQTSSSVKSTRFLMQQI